MALVEDDGAEEAASKLKEEGNVELKAGHDEAALALYTQALQLRPSKATQSLLHSNSAHVLLRQPGRESEALCESEKAIEADPTNVKAFFRAATAAQRLQRHGAAVSFCQSGLQLDGENRDLRNLLKKCKDADRKVPSVRAAAVTADLSAAMQAAEEADRLFSDDQADAALKCHEAALVALGEDMAREPRISQARTLRVKALKGKARCHLELGEYWEAVLAGERASLLCDDQDAAAGLCQGRALRELGLLHTASEKFDNVGKMGTSEAEEAQEENKEVQAVLDMLQKGDAEIVMGEVDRLVKALPNDEATRWLYTASVRCSTDEGRQEMLSNGFLQMEWIEHQTVAEYTARCSQKLLLYQVKKKLQQDLSLLPRPPEMQGQGGGLSVSYTFATPSSLRHPGAELLLKDRHVEELRTRGLTVINQAFDEAAMRALHGECEMLDKKMGILLRDDEDVCNPLQRRFDLPLGDKAMVDASRRDTPVLFQIIDHLRGLPVLLEEKMGLSLRVPETLMLACYPKGAFYRKHLDSYRGEDIPRKVTILLYCNPDWTPGDGGVLRAWLGEQPVEIEPLGGRIVIFMAQDIWHEVTKSQKERYALTQWVWDVKKDRLGR